MFFVFVFVFVFVFCFSFVVVFFYSSPDLNLLLYSILHDFSFKNTKFSASERAHTPQTPPCVCKHAIGADAPPNHPPMSKTDVQPSVVLVY